MFCAKCGKKIDDDSTFCPYCGQKVNAKTGAEKPSRGVSEKTPLSESIKKNKTVIGAVAVLIVVVAVIVGGVKLLGGSKFGKTLPEKLFMMSAKEYIDTTSEDVKNMMDEEGTLCQQTDSGVFSLTTDSFMGYDCIYGYDEYDDDFGATPSGLAWVSDSSYFYIAFNTEDDFKEGQKSLKKYLEKRLVNKTAVLKTDGYFFSGDTYLIECSDKNMDNFWKRVPYPGNDLFEENEWFLEDDLFGYDNSLLRRCGEEDFLDVVDSMDYKLYKFVQVCYPQMDAEVRSLFPSDKSYTDYMCVIQIINIPMTEEQYIAYAGTWGYDAISHKDIDLSKFEADIDTSGWQGGTSIYLPWQDGSIEVEDGAELVLYFMQEHDYDLLSGEYLKDDMEKRKWYLDYFQWDISTNAEADLGGYRDSVEIYLAMTENYNSAMHKPFESDLDKAVYLSYMDYNMETGEGFGGTAEKRVYFMQNYSYDIVSQKEIDHAVVESLFAYADYVENTFKEDIIIGFNLIYIDDDAIPECLVWTEGNHEDYAGRVYILSNKEGDIRSVTSISSDAPNEYTSFYYTPKAGEFMLEEGSSAFGSIIVSSVFSLGHSDFDFICSLATGRGSIDTYGYSINNQNYVEYKLDEPTPELDEFREQLKQYSTSFKCNIYGDRYETYSTLLAAYDALDYITFTTYECCVYQFEIKDGILTVATDDGANYERIDFQTPLSFSYPISEECIWEDGYGYGKYRYEYEIRQTDMETVMADIKRWRELYETSPDDLYNVSQIRFCIKDEVVVGIYTATY